LLFNSRDAARAFASRLYPDLRYQLSWVRELRDQCISQGVAFFFKQWGGATRKAGGRRLDGRYWNEYPVFVPRYSGKPVSVLQRPMRKEDERYSLDY